MCCSREGKCFTYRVGGWNLPPSSPPARLLFLFRPETKHFITHLLIIILTHHATCADYVIPEGGSLRVSGSIRFDLYTYVNMFLHYLPTSHLSHLRKDWPTSPPPPETECARRGGGGERPGHKAAAEPTGSGVLLPPPPSSLKSLRLRRADRGDGWVSFHRGASTCLIIQGHMEQIDKATLMYGEEDNLGVCVGRRGGGWGGHNHLRRVRLGVPRFPNQTLDVSEMQRSCFHLWKVLCSPPGRIRSLVVCLSFQSPHVQLLQLRLELNSMR